jgi:hypothetical protein
MFRSLKSKFTVNAQTKNITIFKGLSKEIIKEGNGVKPKVGEKIKGKKKKKLKKSTLHVKQDLF